MRPSIGLKASAGQFKRSVSVLFVCVCVCVLLFPCWWRVEGARWAGGLRRYRDGEPGIEFRSGFSVKQNPKP